MKGFRTLAFNASIVIVGALLPWAAGLDWTQYVDAKTAALIVGGLNIALRFWTTTPVGTK